MRYLIEYLDEDFDTLETIVEADSPGDAINLLRESRYVKRVISCERLEDEE